MDDAYRLGAIVRMRMDLAEPEGLHGSSSYTVYFLGRKPGRVLSLKTDERLPLLTSIIDSCGASYHNVIS